MKKYISKTMLGALICGAAGFVQAENIDVAFVVSEEVVENHGREWVDTEIERAMSLSNEALGMADLSYQRVVKMVHIEPANGTVTTAARGSQGAYGGIRVACDTLTSEFDYIDNVVWLVPEANGSYKGNAGRCYKNGTVDDGIGKRIAVVATASWSYDADIGAVIAHELGHVDNLSHVEADAYLAETGHTTLMSTSLKPGLSGPLLSPGDVAKLKETDLVNNTWDNFFSWPAAEATDPDSTVSLELVDGASGNSFELMLKLDSPLSEAVSVEFYTQGVTAVVGQDYDEHVARYVFLPGETEKSVDVTLHANTERDSDRTLVLGIRYGDGVNASQTLTTTLAKVDAKPGDGDDGGGETAPSGGSGGGSLGWLASLFLVLATRFRRQ
jgi:hypothetical protein